MVNFHLGKVIMAIAPGKEVISTDASVQAVIEMWDGNQLVLGIDDSIAPQIKQNDVVIVDYSPVIGISQAVPKQTIVKILKGKQAKDCWALFQKYKADKTKKAEGREEPTMPGISYSR